jgi:hypothetical protein
VQKSRDKGFDGWVATVMELLNLFFEGRSNQDVFLAKPLGREL